ncbi:hypothetical protein J7384_05640 [Endozoicomonas sp. G2_1]|uniref:hypothetical protein n=1 Tax=Endozoicomonas sp. G2_1 TaxID=2821091 RepID=UPI001ADC093B|nr:hypothetical protein [Endozoicomonas sp. G2_1]MBO9489838.1 hypothetical protein [Endozoicomonas sp. G2_1]
MPKQLNAEQLLEDIKELAVFNKSIADYPHTSPMSLDLGDDDNNLWEYEDKASFNLTGLLSFHVLNSVDDLKNDPIVQQHNSTPSDGVLSKPITFDANQPHCLYKFIAEGQAKGSSTYDKLGFNFDIAAGFSLGAYRSHPNDFTLLDAVKNDLGSFPVIFSFDDIKELTTGSALDLDVSGEFEVGAEFSWSDLLKDSLRVLSDIVDDDALNITVKAAASVGLSLKVAGGFKVVFAKPTEDNFYIGLKKGSAYTFGADVGLSVGAEFTDPSKVEQFLGEHLDQLFKLPSDAIATGDSVISQIEEELQTAVSYDQLPTRLQPSVDKLFDKLGLDTAEKELAELKERLAEVKSDLQKSIKEVATTKATAAFAYQYKRVKQHDALLEGKIPVASVNVLKQMHASAIKGKFKEVVELFVSNNDCELTAFFNQKVDTTNTSFGFTFTIGDITAFGKDFEEVEKKTTFNVNNHKMIAFDAKRGYKKLYGSRHSTYYFDFDADMTEFSPEHSPTADLFNIGFSTRLETSGDDFSPNKAIDLAHTWGIIDADKLPSALASLENAIAGAEDISCVSTCNVSHDYFEHVLSLLCDIDNEDLGYALGRALSYVDKPYRDNADLREEVFGGMFEHLLNKKKDYPWKISWEEAIEDLDKKLAKFEYHKHANRKQGTFLYTVYKHPKWRLRTKQFTDGLASLYNAITHKKGYEEIQKAYKGMKHLGGNLFYLRFVGALLAITKRSDRMAAQGITGSITISFKKDGVKMKHLIG